ncbi:MAG: hypothetical protein R2788_01565 [Saprospiraceae bacterium]
MIFINIGELPGAVNKNNPLLEHINGFITNEIGGNLEIEDNMALKTMNAFLGLHTVDGSLIFGKQIYPVGNFVSFEKYYLLRWWRSSLFK